MVKIDDFLYKFLIRLGVVNPKEIIESFSREFHLIMSVLSKFREFYKKIRKKPWFCLKLRTKLQESLVDKSIFLQAIVELIIDDFLDFLDKIRSFLIAYGKISLNLNNFNKKPRGIGKLL